MKARSGSPAVGCFLRCLIAAACIILAPQARGEGLPLKMYTSADGLGSSFVDTLTRDSRGFMWFATRDGLSRFDGTRFITYQVGTENAAPGVESIYETRKGVYWIITTGGLYRFRSDAMTNPAARGERPILNAEFVSPMAGTLFEDSRDNLWLSSGVLYRIVENSGQTEFQETKLQLPEIPGQKITINETREAGDGSLWVKSSHGMIRVLPDGRTVFYPFGINVLGVVNIYMIDHVNRLWLTIGGKLLILNPETIAELGEFETTKVLSFENAKRARLDADVLELPDGPGEVIRYDDEGFLEEHQMKYLLQTADDHIWMTTEKQLVEFDGRRVRLYPKIPRTSNMKRMGEDIAGNLWISGTQNLIRLDRRGIATFNEADGLRSTMVYSIQEDREGRIYMANGSHFLTEYFAGNFKTVKLKIAEISRPFWAARPALRDRRGEVWLTSPEGLYRFPRLADFTDLNNAEPIGFYGIEKGLKAKGTFQIFEDSRGDIWVSTFGNTPSEQGLARYDRGADRFVTFTKTEGHPDGKLASSFAEDAHGNIWIAYYQGGILRFRDGRFEEISGIKEISAAFVSDLLFDKVGRLWIASAKYGVLRIDDPNAENAQVTSYTIKNGLSSNNIRTIAADHKGNIYAGTVRGVDRIGPDTGRVKHFSIDDGLASDFVVDSLCDADGSVWFATTNGVSRLKPFENENQKAPQVWIGELSVAGSPLAVGELGSRTLENLEFAYTDNDFQINFFALDFAANEKFKYQYRLEGTDADWSQPTDNRTVNFANLAPGGYRFLVRTVTDSGAVSEDPATVVFQIDPPFWRTWWFSILAAAVVCVALYFIYRYRTKNLRNINQALVATQIAEEKVLLEREKRLAEIERVRTRIATDLHDDIGSSLTQITVFSELARQRERENGKAGEPLDMISGVANELVDTMSDIVWAINPKKDHLHDLTQRMRRFAANVLTAKDIEMTFLAPASETDITLGANIRREVFLIFKETVNNIVKHSEATETEIVFSSQERFLTIKFRDNGKGFDQTAKHHGDQDWQRFRGGNGLLNMRRRAADLGGSYEIRSEINAGTSVILQVPLEVDQEAADKST